ncbi:MAG: hypothetical protein ACPGO3_05455 [Magnetospiraceae bacterium]
MVDLLHEWRTATAAATETHYQWMRAHGVSSRTLNCGRPFGLYPGATVFGAARVTFNTDGTYAPDPAGVPAVIVPCDVQGSGQYIIDPTGSKGGYVVDRGGFLVDVLDLCAFLPREPWKWRTRNGSAKFIDGQAVDRAARHGRRCWIFSTPLDWMRASCLGSVILDRKANLCVDFHGISHIEADSPALAAQIKRQMREPDRYPRITCDYVEVAA